MRLLRLNGLLERILAASRFAFHALNGGFEIGDGRRLDVFFVTDDGGRFGVDVQLGLAAGASYRDQLGHTFQVTLSR